MFRQRVFVSCLDFGYIFYLQLTQLKHIHSDLSHILPMFPVFRSVAFTDHHCLILIDNFLLLISDLNHFTLEDSFLDDNWITFLRFVLVNYENTVNWLNFSSRGLL